MELLKNSDLCRFCLSDSDKSAISLKNPEILIRVDKKIIDLKKILKFLYLNNSFYENLPSTVCSECKTTIVNYYSLKKTFLENENTLNDKSKNLRQHQVMQNLITIFEDFCGSLSEEDSLKIHKDSNKIILEKFEAERSQEQIKSENAPANVCILKNDNFLQNKEDELIEYENEEYIEDHDNNEAKHYGSPIQNNGSEEVNISYGQEAIPKLVVSYGSTNSCDYEIHFENTNLESPPETKIKSKLKKKLKNHTNIEQDDLSIKKFKSFTDQNFLIQQDDNSFMCSNCSLKFSCEKTANEHVKKYGWNKLCTNCQCSECSVIFQSEQLYQKHKTFHILKKIASAFNYFDCQICNCLFGSCKDHEKHMENHMTFENYKLKFDGKPHLEGCTIFQQDLTDDESYWRCGHCGMKFLMKEDINFHITIFHATLFCPFDNQPYGKSLSYLIDHLKTKHPDRLGYDDIRFNCSYCFEEFNLKADMKEHEKSCDNKTFECHHCDKKFGLERQLKEHIDFVNGSIKFVCNFCNKKYNNKSSLTVHMRIHSKEKPYSCTYPGCDKTFRTNSHRSAHMDLHNEMKNFRCDYCPKMFQTRAAKRAHEKSHTYSHLCPLCQKDFKQRSHLVRHVNIVHKIKCGSANLETQIQRMEGEKKN